MNITAALRDKWSAAGDSWTFEFPTGWMQGRSLFGGFTTATLAALGRKVLPEDDRGLRAVNVQLLAPVVPGVATGRASVLRSGRNVTYIDVRLEQEGRPVAQAGLVFAKPITEALNVVPPPRPAVPAPDSLQRVPYVPRAMPEFTQHVDMRWVEGPYPYSSATDPAFTAIFRYDVPTGDAEGVLALLDTFPPPSLSLASKPLPASTMMWTAHLLEAPSAEELSGYCTMRYETLVGTHGLHTTAGWLYGPDGRVLGWTEQLVAVFA